MSFSALAVSLVNTLGLAGIALGVFLNGLGVPGISEVLVPLGGVGVSRGSIDLVSLALVTMLAQLAGVSLAYYIARTGGISLVERYGKYVLISSHELGAAERAFKKYGGRMVVIGAFVPGIQGFVGYAAGVSKMEFGRFLASVAAGKVIWLGGLIYLGSMLGDHLDLIDSSIKQIGVIVLAALVFAGFWYVRRHRKRAKARAVKGAQIED